MKKLLLLFAFLVLLGGGTTSALKFLRLGPFQGDEVVEEKPEEQIGDTTLFVDMEPLAIPIFQGNKVAATVQIQVKLETNGKSNVKKIKRIMPVITDAFVRDLHSFMPRLLKAKEQIDVLIIKQRLQLISNKAAGKGADKKTFWCSRSSTRRVEDAPPVGAASWAVALYRRIWHFPGEFLRGVLGPSYQ